jgi:hypothetical protein
MQLCCGGWCCCLLQTARPHTHLHRLQVDALGAAPHHPQVLHSAAAAAAASSGRRAKALALFTASASTGRGSHRRLLSGLASRGSPRGTTAHSSQLRKCVLRQDNGEGGRGCDC